MYLLALLLLFVSFSAAQTPVGELRLQVSDASGSPVEATGQLEAVAAPFQQRYRTSREGEYRFTSLPQGTYRLRVSREGFSTYFALVDITPAAPVTQAVRLSVGVGSYAVSVVAATPLAGLDRSPSEFAAPIQTATARDLEASGALDLSDFLNRRMNGVYINEVQGNPLQPDLNYRGYTASPLLGTPQGVSIYLDGVRLNQPFGDVVSWDLIPRFAISEVALIAGSNPLFGLNTLGGALSLRTKDGLSHPGTQLQLNGGSFGRKSADFEHGGANRHGLDWFLAGNLFFEDGWRQASPSNVRQFFGHTSYKRAQTSIGLSASFANNSLTGNGLQEQRFLARDYSSYYTKPDQNLNRSPFFTTNILHTLTPNLTFSGLGYFRTIRTNALNGDINEGSLDQSVYQPGAAERAALAAAGYTGFPASGATAANTPFPFWRCIGNVLLRDEPGEKCNGLINRSGTEQRNFGGSGQLSWFRKSGNHRNQLTVGAGFDGNRVTFSQSTQLGYLNPDRSVTGLNAYADGVTGGDVDGEPFDTRVNLVGSIRSGSVYVTDTLSIANRLHLTASGRFNHTSIRNRDRLKPVAGPGSLTGDHAFSRFNPAIGATYLVHPLLNLYGSYTQGSRAPTSIELGCADPATPCKLPNAMAGDPPLEQVITSTWEAGLRSAGEGKWQWSAGWFRAKNRNDILFVAAPQTGFGYFKNFARTQRQGMELNVNSRLGRASFGGGYTLLAATFESRDEVNGTGNSSNLASRSGLRGLESTIAIRPGDHIPLTPRHMAKAYLDWQATSKLLVDVGLIGTSGSYARGNENNGHVPDGVYYLGPGKTPSYAVFNAGGRYQVHRLVQLYLQANNLLDKRYYSAAQLGPTGFTASGNFIARPFAATPSGDFPVQQATFYAPGAPRGIWGGLRLRF